MLTTRPMQRTFPGRADQIARAREFTKRVLGPCPVSDEAVLLVSELATNALEHTFDRGRWPVQDHDLPQRNLAADWRQR